MKKSGSFCDTRGCAQAHECGNNSCYWRQTLVFGRQIWGCPGVNYEINDKIDEKYGRPVRPELRVVTGTNYVGVECDSYAQLEKKPSYIPEELYGMCQQDRGNALKQLKVDKKNFGL